MTLHSDHENAGGAIASKKNMTDKKLNGLQGSGLVMIDTKNMLMTPTVFSAWCIFLKGNE